MNCISRAALKRPDLPGSGTSTLAALFNRAMIEMTRRVAVDVVRTLDFGRPR